MAVLLIFSLNTCGLPGFAIYIEELSQRNGLIEYHYWAVQMPDFLVEGRQHGYNTKLSIFCDKLAKSKQIGAGNS